MFPKCKHRRTAASIELTESHYKKVISKLKVVSTCVHLEMIAQRDAAIKSQGMPEVNVLSEGVEIDSPLVCLDCPLREEPQT